MRAIVAMISVAVLASSSTPSREQTYGGFRQVSIGIQTSEVLTIRQLIRASTVDE